MDRIYVMELVRSFQLGEISRRQFVSRATKALGSVAAANMLLTACQRSDEENPPAVVESQQRDDAEPVVVAGLVTGMVDYPGEDADKPLMGYLARPEDEHQHPAVVVIQEWWGLEEHIKDIARRFAQEGFVAIAPDLYHGVVVSEPDDARKLVMELDMATAINEIRSAIDYLQLQDYVSGGKVGAVGFCMGGRLALQAARQENDLGAVVAFYGTPLTAEEVSDLKVPVMGNYGSEDGGIPVNRVQAMEEALNQVGIDNDIKVYEGAPHAFFNDTRPSYREDASADAWMRTLDWFRKYLA